MINSCITRPQFQKESKSLLDQTVGELVALDFHSAAVFRSFNIDYCCGGKKKLAEVCALQGLDPDTIHQALHATWGLSSGPGQEMDNWELDFLADYILNIHHSYVNRSMPLIAELSNKVTIAHGTRHPELIKIHQHLIELILELETHMYKEERILFPYIKSLVKLFREGQSMESSELENLAHPIKVMEREHETAGVQLRTIHQLSRGYSIPEGACSSYRVFYSMLREFELDLHQHVHLENNILFPKSLILANQLIKENQN